jgi:hypothetical protein
MLEVLGERGSAPERVRVSFWKALIGNVSSRDV